MAWLVRLPLCDPLLLWKSRWWIKKPRQLQLLHEGRVGASLGLVRHQRADQLLRRILGSALSIVSDGKFHTAQSNPRSQSDPRATALRNFMRIFAVALRFANSAPTKR